MAGLKMVRAKRTGSWDGHRRRAGAVFAVAASAEADWFTYEGPAPADAALPVQLTSAAPPPQKGFVEVMQQMGNGEQAPPPQTLAEAGAAEPGASDAAADMGSDDLL